MNKVEVLIEGYADVRPDGKWTASSTTTLVTNNKGKKIVVDPGCNRDLLLGELDKASLTAEDVDYVFLTHHHLDHAINTALFPKAIIVDFDSVQNGDLGWEPTSDMFSEGIEIIKTPGHEPTHASLVVDTEEGKVCVAGDVFWWEKGKGQDTDLDYPDDFASDMATLKESRKLVLKNSDWIIPGHGKKFKVAK